MLRSLYAPAEILVATAIAIAIACASPTIDTPPTWSAEVVSVSTTVGPTGDPVSIVTFAWRESGERYEQATIRVPFGSRAGMLHVGQHVRLAHDGLDWYRVVGVEN